MSFPGHLTTYSGSLNSLRKDKVRRKVLICSLCNLSTFAVFTWGKKCTIHTEKAQDLAAPFKPPWLIQLSKTKLIRIFSHSWWQGYFNLLPVVFLLCIPEEIWFSLCNNFGASWGTKGVFQGGDGAWLPVWLGMNPFIGVSLSFFPAGIWGFIFSWSSMYSPCHGLQVVSWLADVLCLIFLAYPRGGCHTAGLSVALGC